MAGQGGVYADDHPSSCQPHPRGWGWTIWKGSNYNRKKNSKLNTLAKPALVERFSNVEKVLRPNITGRNSATNQSAFLEVTCNLLKAREKSRVQGAIGFGLSSDWLKNWRETFQPITKRSNRNHVITFDSHLKTALSAFLWKHFHLHRLAEFQIWVFHFITDWAR